MAGLGRLAGLGWATAAEITATTARASIRIKPAAKLILTCTALPRLELPLADMGGGGLGEDWTAAVSL